MITNRVQNTGHVPCYNANIRKKVRKTEEIIARSIPLPLTINAVTVKDSHDDYNVYTNALHSQSKQAQSFQHEQSHIKRGHFFDDRPVVVKEDEVQYKK